MGLTARLRRASLWRLLAMLLLPLLALVTGVELWMTRHDALEAANAAYDRSLLGALKSIGANISTASGGLGRSRLRCAAARASAGRVRRGAAQPRCAAQALPLMAPRLPRPRPRHRRAGSR